MGSNDTCLVLITLDSAVLKDDSYYPQVFENLSQFSYSSDEIDEE